MKHLSAAVLFTAVACASGSPASDVEEVALGESFRLAVGEEVRLSSEELLVRFSGVTADSRCPSDLNCFWAGDAAAEVRLARGGEETSVSVHTHGGRDYPRTAEAFGCAVHLEDVAPYPSSKTEIRPEDYVATLKLTLAEAGSQE